MLQTRPNSASAMIQTPQPSHHYSPSSPQMHRNSYHGINSGAATSTYRGHTSVAPVVPYAFTSTPPLSGNPARPSVGILTPSQRTSSAPVTPTMETMERTRYPAAASVSTTSSSSSSDVSAAARSAGITDDSSIATTPSSRWGVTSAARPQSTIITSATHLVPPTQPAVKVSPERYRRPGNRRADSSTSNAQSPTSSIPPSPSNNMNSASTWAQVAQNPHQPGLPASAPQLYAQGVAARSSADDMHLKNTGVEDTSRSRRRSIHTDMSSLGAATPDTFLQAYQQGYAAGVTGTQQHPLRSYPVASSVRPSSSPGHSAATEIIRSNLMLTTSQVSHNCHSRNYHLGIFVRGCFQSHCILKLNLWMVSTVCNKLAIMRISVLFA